MLRTVMAIGGIVAMLLGVAPPALADPPAAPSADANAVISWADLGADKTLSFYGNSSVVSLTIPVPDGLAPVALNATVDLPFTFRSGLITVSQDDRLISKVGLPLADLTPLVIPLPGVRIVDHTVYLELRLAAAPDDGYCLDDLNPVDLINGSVTYAGTDIPPTTVADFLSPILRKLTIGVPSNPTPAEADAAVQLATELVAWYRKRGQATAVAVVPLAGDQATLDGPSVPMERQIIVKEGPDSGLSLVGPGPISQLRISGPANKLKNATRLLTSGALNLAAATNVVTGNLRSERRFPGTITSLAGLGQRVFTSSGIAPQVVIQLDQTKFGYSMQGIRVHVVGTYTPVPSGFGGRVAISVGGEVIESWPVEPSGVIDRWVSIPDRLLERSTSLIVAVNTAGNEGHCNEFRPINLTISGSSLIESAAANPPIPTGFRSLPQALMPEVRVGISNSFADVVRAIQITTGLQRITATPLSTQVQSVKDALASDSPAVIVSPDGWNDKSITLPVSASDRSITLQGGGPDNGPTTLTLDPGTQFGSLQTVFDGRRTLLIATSTGAPGPLDDLLRWLDADPRRWPDLQGNVLVDFPGREPVAVSGRDLISVYGPPVSPVEIVEAGSYRSSPAWWAAGAVLLAAGIGFAAIVASARRGRNGKATSHRGS